MRKPLPAMVFLGLVSLAGTSFANNNESFRGISFAIGPSSVSVNTVVTTTGVAYSDECLTPTECGSAGDGTTESAGANNSFNDTFSNNNFVSRFTAQPQKYMPRLEIGLNFAVEQSGVIGITLSKDFGKLGQRWDLPTDIPVFRNSEDPRDVSIRNDGSGYSTLEGPLALGIKAGYAFTNSTMGYLKVSYNQAKFVAEGLMLDNTDNYPQISKTLDGVGLALGFESNLSEHIFLRGELEAIHYKTFKNNGENTLGTVNALGETRDYDAEWTDKYELRQHAGRLLLGVRF
jgi:hypothetical protein